MLNSVNAFLQRLLPAAAPLALLCGLVWGAPLADFAGAIPLLFAVMTFGAGLALQPSALKTALAKPGFILLSLVVLHFILPLCACIAGVIFYKKPEIFTGIILMSMMPAGASSIAWVSFYKGSLSIALAIIMADTLAAPLFVPIMYKLFAGSEISLNSLQMFKTLLLIILLPTLLALALNQLGQGRPGQILSKIFSLLGKLCIILILLINGGLAAPYFQQFDCSIVSLFVFVPLLFFLGYCISFFIARARFSSRPDILSFTLCTGLRNVGAGVALSVTHFSGLTSFTVVIGMLFQQLLACFAGLGVNRILKD